MQPRFPISFEFFPARSDEGEARLAAVRQQLYPLCPSFVSVTYGAGGSTQAGTLAAVCTVLREGHDAAPHFSALSSDREQVRAQLQTFAAAGIRHIVALRGDLPSGVGGFGEFRYASELVRFIRETTGGRFRIDVACYPEMHPQAASPEADLSAFVAKVRAGADSAITQYFFNGDAYFRFVDETRRLGLDVPVVPGIMPITNSAQLIRFSDSCGTEIPRWIRLRLNAYAQDSASIRAFGLDVVSQLCERLRAGGAPGFHFYTMNQAGPVREICDRLGLGAQQAVAAA